MKQIVTSIADRASAPIAVHAARIAEQRVVAQGLEARANRISIVRLVCFLAGALAAFAGLSQGSLPWLGAGMAAFAAFFVAVVVHARVEQKRREAAERIAVHERHLARLSGRFHTLPSDGEGLLPPDHPYASDIDLTGPGSLFQRIDVSQTREGERALAEALASPLPSERIALRQAAVEELAGKLALREELEVLGRLGQPIKAGAKDGSLSPRQVRENKLDHAPFMALIQLPSLFDQKRWLRPVTYTLVGITVLTILASWLDLVPGKVVWIPVLVQGALLWHFKEPAHHALDLITARLGFAQAYEAMLAVIERENWQSPYLRELRASLDVASQPPSAYMARLRRLEGFVQLKTQGPVYLVLNVVLLWDLLCLDRIERFVRDVGPRCESWFLAVGELEMLCSLATLRHGDPSTIFPDITGAEAGIAAQGLAHPLLGPDSRIANDVALEGPGSLLVVTGSNMAGKSTLLRALGLNVALALAGGPVCARSFRLCPVRLRASMRIDDSLQRGASYFHAELGKLRMVVNDLDHGAPVLFLLDELLRGTNARARNTGARSVLVHLLSRGALGIVATHDIGLAHLEDELPRVHNVHFTDVFEDGEMRFDYKLRPGPVTTSNALRLLAMAGIDVPADDAVA
jgi:hypothetical protein